MTISQFKAGDSIKLPLLIVSSSVKQTKKGDDYWAIEARDKTGVVQVRLWNSRGAAPASGTFAMICGLVEEYRDDFQIKAESVAPVDASMVNVEDFLPTSARPAAEMHAELVGLVTDTIQDDKLKALLVLILTDPNIKPRILRAPAASRNHHAFLGGLLEHILSLWKSASGSMALAYPWLKSDIVYAACVCHDLGKVLEFSTETNIEYSTMGRLVGHVLLGSRIVAVMGSRVKVDESILIQVQHCIASHHGDEFAEIKPQSPEAIFFHFIDNLDSKMGSIKPLLDAAAPESEFTDRVPALGRPVYKGATVTKAANG